ncbi:DUF1456 family protein [Mongoliibacter ruber]|uniref:Uncharacterized protein YehS (DUF1456 family) n=1 Tax=Mongoliibacter ruber TaxID=1750599 RepID=A0A2T0WSJ2_9BACT|nr:DUF1456 family protein [Mongoliibacter ruber]PRY89673.1 uncharacterized protein YehS (DUF1456 family) [Mongoliibacter ruber]
MNNNDIIRSLRYTFDLGDDQMIKLFKNGGRETTREEVSNWLKKEEDEDYKAIYDIDLAAFLNGFIIKHRGKQEGKDPVPEKRLNNNAIFRKIKIALLLKDEDILEMLDEVDFRFSKHELSAIFRKPTQSQYRDCKDQVLRYFLRGLQEKYRGD